MGPSKLTPHSDPKQSLPISQLNTLSHASCIWTVLLLSARLLPSPTGALFPILCFWCLHIPFSLLSPHPLPVSEPDSRAKVEKLKKSDRSVGAGGPKPIQRICQFLLAWHSGCPQNRASPAPAAPTEAAAKPREDGGSHCAGMALLLWKPVIRNRSEQIHSGSSPALGEGRGQTAPWTLPSPLPAL